MVTLLAAVANHTINVDEILYWAGAVLTLTAVVTAIILPLRKMLGKYDKALQKTEQTLKDHADINAQYQMLIDESKADRMQLNADVAAIKRATLTQVKLEINKITERSLKRGWIWGWECAAMEMLFESYKPLGGNGVTASNVEKARKLKVKYEVEEGEK